MSGTRARTMRRSMEPVISRDGPRPRRSFSNSPLKHAKPRGGATMSGLTEAVPPPAHVPSAAVYDFDMRFDPALLADPHEGIRDLLANAPPVFWTPRNGGRWVAIGHEELFKAARDPEHFSSGPMPR